MNNQTVMTDYLLAAIQGLKAAGAKRAVISPGSRSTPLALLLHRDPEITCTVAVDERSAAFFALGCPKLISSQRSYCVLLELQQPIIIQLFVKQKLPILPLIVLTADRPPELRGVGAPQAMDQQNLYASHVKRW